MKVKFADDHEQTFNGKDIKQILKKLVAVPEEYNALPINDINHLISAPLKTECTQNKCAIYSLAVEKRST